MEHVDADHQWLLVYTKSHAEAWAEINLRKQGFETLLPRARQSRGIVPLFPRYLFVGGRDLADLTPVRSTRGVLYVVHCGDAPARVPRDVIDEVKSRMDRHGIVDLPRQRDADPLFARRERERTRALIRLANAGFRVVA